MRITNIRKGRAANSSSTHYLVLRDKNATEDFMSEDDFGWGDFCMKSVEAKRKYLISNMLSGQFSLRNQSMPSVTSSLAYLFDMPFMEMHKIINDIIDEDEYYVDHQSTIHFPLDIHGNVNFSFLKDYVDWILNSEELSFRGGNDNDSYDHHDGDDARVLTSIFRCYYKLYSFEYDGNWVLFDSEDGDRYTINFKRNSLQTEGEFFESTQTPLLLDIKISNHCTMGCSFCYQGSVPELPSGLDVYKYVDYKYEYEDDPVYTEAISKTRKFMTIVEVLHPLEIAIGGGEPTQTPEFWLILEMFARLHSSKSDRFITSINFTTNDLSWLKDRRKVRLVSDAKSFFAVSIRSRKEADAANAAIRDAENRCNVTLHHSFQYVVGLSDGIADFQKILKSGYKITLLGYKEIERGADFNKKSAILGYMKSPEFVEFIDRIYSPFSMDTALVKQVGQSVLDSWKAKRNSYDDREGHVSGYIDMTKMTMHPSSYNLDTTFNLVGMYNMDSNFKEGWDYIRMVSDT